MSRSGNETQTTPKIGTADLANLIWPELRSSVGLFDEAAYIDFFGNYINEARDLLRHHQGRFAVNSPEGTLELRSILKEKEHEPLSAVIEALGKRFLNVESKPIQRSLELCVRLWLTINVNSPSVAVGPIFPYEARLRWAPDLSLKDLIQVRFGKGNTSQQTRARSKIEGTFTAAYLVNTCGVTLHWTDYLTDHLSHDPKQQTLVVYKHKICLLNHLRSKSGCPLPTDVLNEALDTLDLLFPFGDAATKQLLMKENQEILYKLGNRGRNRELDLSRYEYWREELEDLADTFRRPPRTWKQMATDRRNMPEWASFWVTVLVGILTLVSIPCSIIQAMYSVKAYNAAVGQRYMGQSR